MGKTKRGKPAMRMTMLIMKKVVMNEAIDMLLPQFCLTELYPNFSTRQGRISFSFPNSAIIAAAV
ncbi:MAG: hypothetical protein JXM69_14005 [Anaerolineae bacterium]|nr:hypothetical protein [Anaerolineae bacterium]